MVDGWEFKDQYLRIQEYKDHQMSMVLTREATQSRHNSVIYETHLKQKNILNIRQQQPVLVSPDEVAVFC